MAAENRKSEHINLSRAPRLRTPPNVIQHRTNNDIDAWNEQEGSAEKEILKPRQTTIRTPRTPAPWAIFVALIVERRCRQHGGSCGHALRRRRHAKLGATRSARAANGSPGQLRFHAHLLATVRTGHGDEIGIAHDQRHSSILVARNRPIIVAWRSGRVNECGRNCPGLRHRTDQVCRLAFFAYPSLRTGIASAFSSFGVSIFKRLALQSNPATD